MKKWIKIVFFLLITTFISPPKTIGQQSNNPKFDKMLKRLLSFSVPTISVKDLRRRQKEENIYLLDARELEEYQVSHIKGATNVGYDKFKTESVAHIPKNKTIVIYCSVGYRSEQIGKKLQRLGYKKVYNLYGSIFEWANEGYPVVDKNNETTHKVHTYNKRWSKWLLKGEKVY